MKFKEYDKTVIVSADSDFLNIPNKLLDLYPTKSLAYIFPYISHSYKFNRWIKKNCKELARHRKKNIKLLRPFTLEEYEISQFPNKFKINNEIIKRPEKYKSNKPIF